MYNYDFEMKKDVKNFIIEKGYSLENIETDSSLKNLIYAEAFENDDIMYKYGEATRKYVEDNLDYLEYAANGDFNDIGRAYIRSDYEYLDHLIREDNLAMVITFALDEAKKELENGAKNE